ncbi:UDP-N-acetylmuramoyl-L-alanine--D-glutamate ligase [Lichenicoccus roseus]|uniref:UDP-N-acetylmuramoylalanine--D-glutamate ligase n=1 Tax=Lichenicoccus roseus TaxID=2683649 RepID=A0A5R9J7A9_9PROT|nr:UDP-N-acetylmuramoyl-L-alanine--D-glutamate ligase [Lichenicoccus roseus]TLU73510.1 UDP-N-acetylmuramoyl-L-alanine--D-glutamate ligase [Lichenicoccus roseus]
MSGIDPRTRAFPGDLFAGRRYAVLGLGRNGAAAAHALAGMGAGVIAWDDREAARDALADAPTTVRLAPIDSLDGIDALVLSPGIPHRLPVPHPVAARALLEGIPVLSDAELLFEAVRATGSRARFAGITGTNGKSTTTALLAHLLAEAGIPVAAGGNLGPAALSLPLLPDRGVYVLEMSSYMLERLATLRFDAAALLNLAPDHLDRHGDLAAYGAVKLGIFDRQEEGDLAVLGLDDTWSAGQQEHLQDGPAVLVTISGEDGLPAPAPALPGAHNAQNARAAVAMARHLGVPEAAIAPALASFPGLAHRQRFVAAIDAIDFIDDSKATNADAAARALACYDRLVWIAGGVAKAGGIDELAPYFPRIAEALLIGRDAPMLAATLSAHGVRHRIVGTLDNAVPAALDAARTHAAPVVLLSPACASFDQFPDFEARGRQFASLVQGASTLATPGPETPGPAAGPGTPAIRMGSAA